MSKITWVSKSGNTSVLNIAIKSDGDAVFDLHRDKTVHTDITAQAAAEVVAALTEAFPEINDDTYYARIAWTSESSSYGRGGEEVSWMSVRNATDFEDAARRRVSWTAEPDEYTSVRVKHRGVTKEFKIVHPDVPAFTLEEVA